jgi:hypothetical protein
MNTPAALIAWTDINATAEGRGPFGHAAETQPRAYAYSVGPTVVGYVDVQRVRARPNADLRPRCVRVA